MMGSPSASRRRRGPARKAGLPRRFVVVPLVAAGAALALGFFGTLTLFPYADESVPKPLEYADAYASLPAGSGLFLAPGSAFRVQDAPLLAGTFLREARQLTSRYLSNTLACRGCHWAKSGPLPVSDFPRGHKGTLRGPVTKVSL